jgi:hypothetical protein
VFVKTMPVVDICPSILGVLYRQRLSRNVSVQYCSIIDIIGSMTVKDGIGVLFHRSVLLPGVSAPTTPLLTIAKSAATQVTT